MAQTNSRECPICLTNYRDIKQSNIFHPTNSNGNKLNSVVYDVQELGHWIFKYGKKLYPHNRQKISQTEMEEIWNKYENKSNARFDVDTMTESNSTSSNSSSNSNSSIYSDNDSWLNTPIDVMWLSLLEAHYTLFRLFTNCMNSARRRIPVNQPQPSQGNTHLDGGVPKQIKYKGNLYKVHVGSRGGKYIVCKGKHIYV